MKNESSEDRRTNGLATPQAKSAAWSVSWLGTIWLAVYWATVATAVICAAVLVTTRAVLWDADTPWWPLLTFGGLFFFELALALLAGWRLSRNANWMRTWLMTHPLAIATSCCCVAMTIVTVRTTVLPWPMRELRPTSLNVAKTDLTEADLPWGQNTAELDWYCPHNSWGLRDVKRKVTKDPAVFRVLFVGDSFLEGGFCHAPLSIVCQLGLPRDSTSRPVECINLGVNATTPIDYYYRLKNVGQHLSPDAVCLFIYSGNDYLEPYQAYQPHAQMVFNRWIEDRPRPSLIGEIWPELAWLLRNRRSAWKARSTSNQSPSEHETLTAATKQPFQEGVRTLAEYFHKNYYPQHSPSRLEEIIGRGGPEWWAELQEKPRDSELLQGWILINLIASEMAKGDVPRVPEDVSPKQVLPHVEATMSWVQTIRRQCDGMNIPLIVAVIPKGDTDPELKKFWAPWPADYHTAALIQNARHAEFSRQLKNENYRVVDLWETLDGVPGTYRKTDSHWTEKGHQLVADRVVAEIRSLLDSEPVTVARQSANQQGISR